MAAPALAEALEHLVKGIVDHPEQVRVDARETPRGELLEVRVNPRDLGRVIGRGGRTAQSLRTVIGSLADGHRVRVDVVDTDAEGGSDTSDAPNAEARA
ncbi:RNA-binding protein [Leucobacter sp. HNU]|uniref:RNA-binding protein n=1 Tax=Leucobacter sp. HNU TaxID=3236805 RepID=UPI003A81169C